MSILQFLRILWARRIVVLVATMGCLIGATIVVLIVPPRWMASVRVMVDVAKPDLMTGGALNAYNGAVENQLALATDSSVAGQAIDDLGLASDPTLIHAYDSRAHGDTRDFHHWLEQILVANTKAKVIGDSSIIEISYMAPRPEMARTIADAISKAFIQTNLLRKRATAAQNAQWLESRSLQAKADLDTAINAQTAYERANGLVMANDKQDVDTSRLQAMSAAGPQMTVAPPTMITSSSAAIQLAEVDASIATQSKTLGPNNPTIVQLKAQRANLQGAVAKESANERMLAGIAAQNSVAVARQINAQKAKVVDESDKIGRLNQLQADVDLRRDVYNKISGLAAQQQEEALTLDSGLTALGGASVPRKPAFPNLMVVYPGALAMGLGIGLLAALLMEFMARRVRGVEDLASAFSAPVLGAIAGPPHTGSMLAMARGLPILAARKGGAS